MLWGKGFLFHIPVFLFLWINITDPWFKFFGSFFSSFHCKFHFPFPLLDLPLLRRGQENGFFLFIACYNTSSVHTSCTFWRQLSWFFSFGVAYVLLKKYFMKRITTRSNTNVYPSSKYTNNTFLQDERNEQWPIYCS